MTLASADAAETDISGVRRTDANGFVSAASFWSPIRSGVGSGWIEHAPFAFWLIEALRPRCFAELGSYKGYSYAAVCQAVQRLGIGTACYAIDTWQGDDHAGFYGESVFDDLQAFNDGHFASFSRLVRATFSEASRHFADGSVDLLHIDGRHGYEDVKADYEEWERKLAPGAVVLFHDTNVRERGFGVFRFWDEISRGRPRFEFLHGNGLGVLGSGEVVAPRLRALFRAADDEALTAEVRATYARLGGALTDAYASQSLRTEAAAAQQAVRDQQGRLADLQRQRAAFEAGCRERDAALTALHEQVRTLARERGAFEDGCRERDASLMALHERVSTLTRERAAFEGGCRERDADIAALRSELDEAGLQNAASQEALQEVLLAREAEIGRLHHAVAEVERRLALEQAAREDKLIPSLRRRVRRITGR